MFKNEADFEKLVGRLNIDNEPNPAHRENLRRQMLSAFNETGGQSSPRTTVFQTLRKTIMKSPISKFAAAAAVIIIAIMIGINYFGGSIDGSTVALAQVKKAMEKVDWLHGINKATGGDTEEWYSFQSQIKILKENGKITYWNYGEGKKYVYVSSKGSITVFDISDENFAIGAASPFEFIERLIKLEQDRGAELIRKAGKYNDTKAEIWQVTRLEENGIEKIKLFIDIKKCLPIAGEVKYTDIKGDIAYKGNIKFEYPEEGPQDIYALGVPRTAKIIDKTRLPVVIPTPGRQPVPTPGDTSPR